MDIIQRIHSAYPEMTKKQKSIADCLLESPEDIAYITLAQLSQKTSSSELTLLRFCQKVGYSSFLEMKSAFREYTQNMVKAPLVAAVLCPGWPPSPTSAEIGAAASDLQGGVGCLQGIFCFA